jgi:parvulin-like peptidyl-prolyl isomerase
MMRKLTRAAAALVLGSTIAATAAAQAPNVQPGAPAAPGAPPTRPQGVAAVVGTQQIPEVAVYRALRTFPPNHQEAARKEILTHLIETAIVDQYLTSLKVEVPPAEVDKLIGELKKELADAKKDYNKELEAMLLTEAEFRVEVVAQMKWEKFVKEQATDAALKKMFDTNPTVFDGSLVRARHILLTPGGDPQKQQEAAGKLRGIKQVVEQEAKKAVDALGPNADPVTREKARAARTDELFAAYAKQESVCPSKKDGGDLNLFPRAGAMVEPFAKAAFDLPVWGMSDVVATEFGYHLILVTDKRPGKQPQFEAVKEDVKVLYAMRLREAIIAQQKPKSQITITPVAAPPGTPGAGAAPGAPGAPGAGIPIKP